MDWDVVQVHFTVFIRKLMKRNNSSKYNSNHDFNRRVCSEISWITARMDEELEVSNDQSETPVPPAPLVASTCGHNQYYHGTNNPGTGIVGGVNASENMY